MAKIRTFVAIEVSGAVHALAAKMIKQLTPMAGDYRWADRDTFHLTTNFLGDIAEQEIPDVCRCVKRAVEGFSEFAIDFGGIGAFPRAERPKVLWTGVNQGLEKLLELQEALAEGLQEDMGFPRDRNDYTPHLTLGRANSNAAWTSELLERLATEDAAECEQAISFVDEIVVFSSYRDKSGPSYTPMATIELD